MWFSTNKKLIKTKSQLDRIPFVPGRMHIDYFCVKYLCTLSMILTRQWLCNGKTWEPVSVSHFFCLGILSSVLFWTWFPWIQLFIMLEDCKSAAYFILSYHRWLYVSLQFSNYFLVVFGSQEQLEQQSHQSSRSHFCFNQLFSIWLRKQNKFLNPNNRFCWRKLYLLSDWTFVVFNFISFLIKNTKRTFLKNTL